MSERGKKTGLIQNGGVMTSRDSAPVLSFGWDEVRVGNPGLGGLGLIGPTVNFLRAGCSMVQWLVEFTPSEPSDNKVSPKYQRLVITNGIQDMLTNVTILGEETFRVQYKTRWTIGSVITITRRVAQETKNMMFGVWPK